MTCSRCGTENKPGKRFCTGCGNSLLAACPACGAALAPEDRFCGDCGAALAGGAARAVEQPSPDAAPPRTSERRHVSVLFADLVGFTSLSLQRDAEDVRELLSRYFATGRSVIERYGGTVEKFIGDAVMAVWGVPVAQEDDAERAVRAALDLVDAVAALGDEVGAAELRARAGVLTGEAAVNLGAVGEGMVAGDLVNTASRVQTAAEPGTVYVGEATRRATEASIEYLDTGEHQLKGKPEPVRLWQARRVVAGRRGLMRPTGLEPPFTGRDRELRLLKEYLHATSEERRARLLSIVGVAGVGKSRLAWEFEKYVDGLTESVLWHRGRCLSYGEGVTYWALAEMVRMRCGVVENERPDVARQKVRDTVAEYIGDPEESRWVEPRLAQLLGLEERTTTDPRDLFAAWRFFFEKLAAQALTVLVFEDLQWADSGLFDFIEYLLEWSRTAPILVVTLARPEVSERRPGWGIGKRGLTSLYLEPLPREAMETLLTGTVPGLPQELRGRILDRAAGIPLYAVETVRMLLDRGMLVEKDGTYEVRGSLESLEVPESLHAMIAARLDALPPDERRVLQDASVLGKSFAPAALQAVAGLPDAELERLLDRLVAKDMLAIESDPRSPERGQYAFVQDLVRSVAEGTLSRRERKQRHLAAADYLSSTWSDEDEIAEVVATHLAEAHDLDPDAVDAEQIRDRARAALVLAAEHAMSFAAAAAAQRYYEQALALGWDGATAALLHERAGEAASVHGSLQAARRHFDAALAEREHLGDAIGAAKVVVGRSQIDLREGHLDRGKKDSRQAMDVLAAAPGEDEERDSMLANAGLNLATGMYFSGDLDSCWPVLEQALALADRLGLAEPLLRGLDVKSWLLAGQQRLTEARIVAEGALATATAAGLVRLVALIGVNLAEMLDDFDLLQDSIKRAQQAEEAGMRVGSPTALYAYLERVGPSIELGSWDECDRLQQRYEHEPPEVTGSYVTFAPLTLLFVWLHLRRGKGEHARTQIARAETLGSRGDASIEVQIMLAAARAAIENGERRHAAALGSAKHAFQLTHGHFFPRYERLILIEAMDAAFGLEDEQKVVELLEFARERFRPGSQPSIDAHMHRWNARLEAGRGNGDEAENRFSAAEESFSDLHRPFWLAMTRLEHAEWLADQQRADDAAPLLAEARKTFEELRATPWIERVDAVLPQPQAVAR